MIMWCLFIGKSCTNSILNPIERVILNHEKTSRSTFFVIDHGVMF